MVAEPNIARGRRRVAVSRTGYDRGAAVPLVSDSFGSTEEPDGADALIAAEYGCQAIGLG